jgi:hypothetical protein
MAMRKIPLFELNEDVSSTLASKHRLPLEQQWVATFDGAYWKTTSFIGANSKEEATELATQSNKGDNTIDVLSLTDYLANNPGLLNHIVDSLPSKMGISNSGLCSRKKVKRNSTRGAAPVKTELSQGEIDIASGLNIHDVSGFFIDPPVSIDALKEALIEQASELSEEQINVLWKLIAGQLVMVELDANHDGDYSGVVGTGKKRWPYMIESAIDHDPYTVYMKYPIDFDTSY